MRFLFYLLFCGHHHPCTQPWGAWIPAPITVGGAGGGASLAAKSHPPKLTFEHLKSRIKVRWVMLEGKVAWSPQWLQEGSHAKAELHKRDAQATAAFWGAFPFYNSMCAALKVPQERKKSANSP